MLTAGGAPEPGAVVSLLDDGSQHRRVGSTRTQADGSFVFEGVASSLRPIAIQVSPECPGGGLSVLHPERYEVTEGGEIEGVEVLLPARARLSGRVVDSQGQPLAGMYIETRTDLTNWREASFTDIEGRYVLDRLPAGVPVRIHVGEDDGTARRHVATTVTLEPGETRTGFDITAGPPAGAISGRVVFEDGSPIHEGNVSLRSSGRAYSGMNVHRGRFSYDPERIPEEGELTLWATISADFRDPDPPYAFLISEDMSVERGDTDISIHLDRTSTGRIQGRFAAGSYERPSRLGATIYRAGGTSGRGVRVFVEGDAFRIPPVTAGRYDLVLDGDTIEKKTLTIEVPVGGTVDVGEIAFDDPDEVRGTVTDAEGNPIAGAYVGYDFFLSPWQELPPHPQPGPKVTVTGEDGRFALYRQQGTLSVWKPGLAPIRSFHPTEGEEPVARLLPCGALVLANVPPELSNASNSSRYSWAILIECHEPPSALGDYQAKRSWSSSSYASPTRVQGLPVGRYTVHLWHKTDESQREPPSAPIEKEYLRFAADIVAGQETTIDVSEAW